MSKVDEVPITSLSRSELLDLLEQQAVFTETLRRVCNVALSHAGHIISNHVKNAPRDKLRALAKAQIDADALLITAAPVRMKEHWRQ